LVFGSFEEFFFFVSVCQFGWFFVFVVLRSLWPSVFGSFEKSMFFCFVVGKFLPVWTVFVFWFLVVLNVFWLLFFGQFLPVRTVFVFWFLAVLIGFWFLVSFCRFGQFLVFGRFEGFFVFDWFLPVCTVFGFWFLVNSTDLLFLGWIGRLDRFSRFLFLVDLTGLIELVFG
jgi:hypothetical protein